MDVEISKMTKKILEKQGMKFKLNTKVLGGDDSGEGVKLKVEASKGGKEETVTTPKYSSSPQIPRPHVILTPKPSSSTPTSFSSPSVAAPTPLDWASKTSAWKSTQKAAS